MLLGTRIPMAMRFIFVLEMQSHALTLNKV